MKMTGKWKPKPKKVVETSLGKAPKDPEKGPDISHLRKPITTSISGLKQVLSLFQTATTEVQDYITNECEILYECKVCRTIFRSLANFILHKRNYCREKIQFGGGSTEGGFVINDDLKTSDEESRCATPVEKSDNESVKTENKKTILPVIDRLLKKQKVKILARDTLNEDLSNKEENSDDDVIFVSEENLVLEKIDSSEAAFFQTSVKDYEKLKKDKELMKSEILEIHGILENNQAVLDSTGKVCNFGTKKLQKPDIPKQNLVCTECNFTFSTEKTLTHHIKYKHNKTCIVFPCPDCKETFSNAWSVYRHLYKVHRRTNSQVRRMRYLVHSSGIRKDQEPEKKKRKLNVEENEENQWMNNFEGDKDFQMCGGCGKRFERKAALHSHSQMCTKRIALCNSIKNVKGAKNEKKLEKVEPTNEIVLKGAAKRKQKLPTIVQIKLSGGKKNESKNEDKEQKVEDVKKSPNKEKRAQVKSPSKEENVEESTSDIKIVNEEIKATETVFVQSFEDQAEEKIDEPKQESPVSDKQKTVTITKSNDIIITKQDEDQVDITITKTEDPNPEPIHLAELPEIEIFTISDDSSTDTDAEKNKKTLKRKHNSGSSNVEDSDISDEYKEYVNDEGDHCFLAKTMSFIDKNNLKCTPCGSTFLSVYMLLRHMSSHFSWFRFQCSKCSFVSFHKYDCTAHAYSSHSTPNNLIESTVLPIPNWKVLCTSHDFKTLSEETTDNQADSSNKTMPQLEAIEEKTEENELEEHGFLVPETIILEDDEMPDICTESTFSDTVVLSDDETKECVSSGEKKKVKAGPSKVVSDRPIRNRTKSVKTVQNDFIYDLGKALKLNDNSVKNKKAKKSLIKM